MTDPLMKSLMSFSSTDFAAFFAPIQVLPKDIVLGTGLASIQLAIESSNLYEPTKNLVASSFSTSSLNRMINGIKKDTPQQFSAFLSTQEHLQRRFSPYNEFSTRLSKMTKSFQPTFNILTELATTTSALKLNETRSKLYFSNENYTPEFIIDSFQDCAPFIEAVQQDFNSLSPNKVKELIEGDNLFEFIISHFYSYFKKFSDISLPVFWERYQDLLLFICASLLAVYLTATELNHVDHTTELIKTEIVDFKEDVNNGFETISTVIQEDVQEHKKLIELQEKEVQKVQEFHDEMEKRFDRLEKMIIEKNKE